MKSKRIMKLFTIVLLVFAAQFRVDAAEFPHWKAVARSDLIVFGKLAMDAVPRGIHTESEKKYPIRISVIEMITNRMGIQIDKNLQLISTTQDEFLKREIGRQGIFFLQADRFTVEALTGARRTAIEGRFAVQSDSDFFAADRGSVEDLKSEIERLGELVAQIPAIKGCTPEIEAKVATWLGGVARGTNQIRIMIEAEHTKSAIACLLSKAIAPTPTDLRVLESKGSRLMFEGRHERYNVRSPFSAADCILMILAGNYFGASWNSDSQYLIEKSIFGWKLYAKMNGYLD